ncbi:MAG: response regulator [Pseudomonadota bacterium]
MTLGRKVSFATILFGIVLTIGALAVLRVTILPAFQDLEVESAEKDRSRILMATNGEFEALNILFKEYAHWDYIYDAVAAGDADAINQQMGIDNWADGSIDTVLVYDSNGRLVHGWAVSMEDREPVALVDVFQFDANNPAEEILAGLAAARGFISLPNRMLRVIGGEVLRTDLSGPPVGTLVLGAYFTDADFNELARQVSGTVSVEYFRDQRVANSRPGDFKIELNDEQVTMRLPVPDIFGTLIGELIVETDRDITAAGRESIMRAVTVIGLGVVLIMLASLLFMNGQIVSPLRNLTGIMQRMRSTGNLNIQADSRRRDEIGQLAREFKELVTKLDLARHDLEEARDEAVAYALSKSEFLARMSHEIRTPMNGVVGMTELLKNTELTEHQTRCVRTIGESGSTLVSLINDILDFSKIDAGKMSMESADVNLRELLEETIEGFAETASRKGLELVSSIPGNVNAIVKTDPTRLRQVVVNLLGNALKFTKAGEVVLRVEADSVDDELNVHFAVSDTGVGIRDDAKDSIFEAFAQEDNSTTRMYGGTGLGLAISNQIVGLMGGTLSLDSVVGEGSTFSFSLNMPLVRSVGARSKLMRDRRVIVVEDNASARIALADLLEHLGAEVATATSLAELPELIEEKPVDLLLVDGRQRLLGDSDHLRTLMEKKSAPSLIFASPITDMIDGGELALWSANTCITKPVRFGDLESALVNATGAYATMPTEDQAEDAVIVPLAGRILLAEDNAVNQMVAIGILQHLGLEVAVANNGQEAVDMFIADDFDAILMDCQMPVLDGFKATQAIREWEKRHKKTRMPVIALTANAMATDRQLCIYAGMDDYLAKPFKPEEMRATLETWLSGSGERESA